MSDFQKFLDQALKNIDINPVENEEEHTEYDVFEEVRKQIINAIYRSIDQGLTEYRHFEEILIIFRKTL